MVKSLKQKRGTTAFNDTFVGVDGEVTLDLEKREFRIHDGATPGGKVVGGGAGGVSGPVNIEGVLDDVFSLPVPVDYSEGSTFIIDGAYWTLINGEFKNIGTMRGPEGLSAYEMARQTGYTGSVLKWLESLRGADGIGLRVLGERRIIEELPTGDNQNGDAYIVMRVMWVWVNTRWVEVGQVGPRGESAFQLAKEQRLIPTEYTLNDYLASLQGKDTYEIAVNEGYIPSDWTRQEWLTTLQGKDAYELATQSGWFSGTMEAWFDTLRGDRGVQGERGSPGPAGQPSNAVKVLGRVNTVDALPTNRDPGDAYYVLRDLHVFNGDSYMNVGPVVGEKGDQGVQGPMGSVGDRGVRGESAYDVAVREAVFSGTAAQWARSLTGMSAFDMAREVFGGGIGTEEEWLSSLYGADAYETALARGEIDLIEEAHDYFRGPEGVQGVQGPVGEGLRIKGRVDSIAQLPTLNVQEYDVFSVTDNLYVYISGDWQHMGSFRGIRILGTYTNADQLPEGSEINDAYLVGQDLYVMTATGWANAGQVRGPVGPQGVRGDQGFKGLTGDQGPVGVKGDVGGRGETGPEGPQGTQGEQGDRGEVGSGLIIAGTLPSVDSLPDNVGLNEAYLIDRVLWINPTGSEWVNAGEIQGPQGIAGEKGDRGATGTPGTNGARGAEGSGVRILGAVAAENMLPMGTANGDGFLVNEDLYVSVNGVWKNAGPVRGPIGLAGPQGGVGEPGDDGFGVRFIGRLTQAGDLPMTGIEARDAFVIGTKVYSWSGNEWVDLGDLAGPQGDLGDRGVQGPEGQRGAQGVQGRPGTRGPAGPRGVQGVTGRDGRTGEAGGTGPAGRGIAIVGELANQSQLPGSWSTDDSGYMINGELWLFEPIMSKWFNAGPIQGPRGVAGPNGITGPDGSDGPEGARGPRGAIWINAPREPGALDGTPGDYFINTTSRGYYTKLDAVEWLLLGTLDGTGFIDAPEDGRRYVRRNGVWAEVEVVEAPANGEYHARRNGQWVKVPTGLTEAPNDGKAYVRKENSWAISPVGEAPTDGEFYGRSAGGWSMMDRYTVKAAASTGVLDLSKAQTFTLDGTQNLSVVFDRVPPAGRAMTVVLTINGGSGMITWPSAVNWNQTLPPILGDAYTVVVLLWTGSVWVGSVGITI